MHNRAKEGILLADPKDRWEQEQEHDKILAEHPSYGRALILTKAGQYSWQPIVWDQKLRERGRGSMRRGGELRGAAIRNHFHPLQFREMKYRNTKNFANARLSKASFRLRKVTTTGHP